MSWFLILIASPSITVFFVRELHRLVTLNIEPKERDISCRTGWTDWDRRIFNEWISNDSSPAMYRVSYNYAYWSSRVTRTCTSCVRLLIEPSHSTDRGDCFAYLSSLYFYFILSELSPYLLSLISDLFVVPFARFRDKYYFSSTLYKFIYTRRLRCLPIKTLFLVVTGQCFKWFASAIDGTLGRGGFQCNNMSSEG